jgi:hypothetical protein
LDERIEALAQSVEQLASMQGDHEHRFEDSQKALKDSVESTLTLHKDLHQRFEEHRTCIVRVMEALIHNDPELTSVQKDLRDVVTRLSVIAEIHDAKLEHHDRRLGPE